MMAATLTIKNLNTENNVLKNMTWSHPVQDNVTTHVEDENGNWKPNPNYEGSFEIILSCDSACHCVEQ